MESPFLQSQSNRLLKIIKDSLDRFNTMLENEWYLKVNGSKWSKKEILGHLIDSAANNHLRFVSTQLAIEAGEPLLLVEHSFAADIYEQEPFVSLQHYQEINIHNLIQLWYSYNLHLSKVISYINPKNLYICFEHNLSFSNMDNSYSLSFLITEYVNHLKHHLKQIFENG